MNKGGRISILGIGKLLNWTVEGTVSVMGQGSLFSPDMQPKSRNNEAVNP